jgi:PAS domain S-box-containing protein
VGVEPAVAGLEGILDVLPSPLLLIEPVTARVFYANRAAHRLAGGAFPTGAGAERYHELYRCYDEHGRRIPNDEMPGVRAARGERISNFQMDWETPDGLRSLVVAGDTVVLAGGDPVTVLTFEDVTELVTARRHNELLADASGLLARSLDWDETLKTVARLAVPAYADWCFVELLQPDGSIERVVTEHADPGKREFVEEYDRRYPLDPDSPVGSPQVIRTGEPVLMSEMPDGFWEAVAQDPEQLRLLREVGFVSSLIVPLRVRGVVIGDLALASAESGRRYDEHDLRVAQELADRCALALDNARLYTSLREADAASRRSRDELEAILEGVADAVTAQAPDGRLVYANDAAVRLLSFESAAELLAAPPLEIMARFSMRAEDGSELPLERLPGRRALTGERPEPLTVRYRHHASAEDRWSRVQSTPVFDEDGRVRLAINVIEDITDIKRGEEGHRFLSEASRVLVASLDYEETLGAVARLAVPEIADWCAVDLVTPDGLARVAVAHVDPERVELARRLQDRYPPDPSRDVGVWAVLRSGRAQLFHEIPDELLESAAQDAAHLELLRSVGLRSAMIAPMTLRDRVLGALTFVSAESGRRYDDHDLALAEDLSLRAAAAVENARLYQARSAIAHTLQASLLPPVLPELPGIEIAAEYRPAGEGFEVGGDFYDVFSTAEDQWYAVIGDVCGKGAEAAAVTALARYTIRATAVRRRSPSAILRWLSDAMIQQGEAGGRFCTIACAHLDLARSPARVTVACGGHPLPLVVRGDGGVDEVGIPGTLLGLVPQPDLQDRSTELRPGDVLVLYTDGLTEAGAPARVWSPAELAASAGGATGRPAAEVVEHLVSAALGGLAAPRDDVAVLALRAA